MLLDDPAFAILFWNWDSPADPKNVDEEKQKSRNLTIMYRQVVSGGKMPRFFLGSSYCAGDDPGLGAGSMENIPHGPVHICCGDRTQPSLEDMGKELLLCGMGSDLLRSSRERRSDLDSVEDIRRKTKRFQGSGLVEFRVHLLR
ncbi:hypothetical protein CsSME_00030540 [Camellia sinensis var. sinensis]